MSARKRVLQISGIAAGVIGGVAAAAPDNALGRRVRRTTRVLARDIRYFAASTPGILYRLAGRHPDPNVTDDILADRIRSTIGPLEKRLDTPRVHVMVDDHVAVLHGEVPDGRVACAIEDAILRVSGVDGVESHLHLGLLRGDTRPSEGEALSDSEALQKLLAAAKAAGARYPYAATRAVLCAFADRIPEDEWRQVLGHLPDDVRHIALAPRRFGRLRKHIKTFEGLVDAVSESSAVERGQADEVTRAVVGVLRTLVPDEASDVSSVLPTELQVFWEGAGTVPTDAR
jgi:uncharacterized protein (DUF2267 family)